MSLLAPEQLEQLRRVEQQGRKLARAKKAVRAATENVKNATFEALDADVPLSRVAEAAGVKRSLIYFWIRKAEEA